MTRGLDQIFDPELRHEIAELIEDVRLNGDVAVARALEEFDGCDVDPAQLHVSEEEFVRGPGDRLL